MCQLFPNVSISLTQSQRFGFDKMILNFTSKDKHAKITSNIQKKKNMWGDCLIRYIATVIKAIYPGARMDKSEK